MSFQGFSPSSTNWWRFRAGGVQVHLFEGNHDFYLADYFTRYHGIEVFQDTAQIPLDGKTIFIAHGDLVDETDRGYRILRRVLRSPVFYGIQKRLPLSWLWRIAMRSSEASKEYLAKPQEGLAEKMEAFALAKFEGGLDTVILGHCHLPVIKTQEIRGRQCHFILLGDWLVHRSYVILEDGAIRALPATTAGPFRSPFPPFVRP